MDIRIFVGAHRTASQHIYNVLEENSALLEDQGKVIVMPDDFHKALKVAYDEMEKGKDRETAFNNFLKTTTKGKQFTSLVLLSQRFSGAVTRPVGREFIYPETRFHTRKLKRLMPTESMRFFAGIRDLTTFLPSCYSESLTQAKVESFQDYLSDAAISKLRWSDWLFRLIKSNLEGDSHREHAIIWRYEDYHLIWRDVIQAITGIENAQELVGDLQVVNRGLSLYGGHLMYKYLQKYKPEKPGDFKKVRDAFLEKFPNKDKIADDPVWTPEFVEQMSFTYEDDWYYIERMENVATLSPRPRY